MRNLIVFCSTGYMGEESVEALTVPDFYDEDQTMEACRAMAYENASMYGREVGDYDEDSDDIYEDYQVEYYYEDYDPERHDELRGGDGSFMMDFV